MAPPVVRFTHLSLPGREVGFLMFSSGVFILVLYYVFGPLFRSLINVFFRAKNHSKEGATRTKGGKISN